jgi:hypothetical protein
MKLKDFFIKKEEIIEWDALNEKCKSIGVSVFKTDILNTNFKSTDSVLVIGGSDYEINHSNFKLYPELKKLIGQNLNILDSRVEAMPIGLPSY